MGQDEGTGISKRSFIYVIPSPRPAIPGLDCGILARHPALTAQPLYSAHRHPAAVMNQGDCPLPAVTAPRSMDRCAGPLSRVPGDAARSSRDMPAFPSGMKNADFCR